MKIVLAVTAFACFSQSHRLVFLSGVCVWLVVLDRTKNYSLWCLYTSRHNSLPLSLMLIMPAWPSCHRVSTPAGPGPRPKQAYFGAKQGDGARLVHAATTTLAAVEAARSLSQRPVWGAGRPPTLPKAVSCAPPSSALKSTPRWRAEQMLAHHRGGQLTPSRGQPQWPRRGSWRKASAHCAAGAQSIEHKIRAGPAQERGTKPGDRKQGMDEVPSATASCDKDIPSPTREQKSRSSCTRESAGGAVRCSAKLCTKYHH